MRDGRWSCLLPSFGLFCNCLQSNKKNFCLLNRLFPWMLHSVVSMWHAEEHNTIMIEHDWTFWWCVPVPQTTPVISEFCSISSCNSVLGQNNLIQKFIYWSCISVGWQDMYSVGWKQRRIMLLKANIAHNYYSQKLILQFAVGKILEDWLVNLKFIGNWIHHMCGEILSCFFVNSQTGEGIIAVLSHLLKCKNEYDHTIWVWMFFVQMDCWQEDHYTFRIFLLSATCLSCSDSWY